MADINILNLVAQKKQASEQAVRAAAPVRGATDERGKVSLWLISQKKWAKFWPVDAMDILKSGTANLDGPEPEIVSEPEPEPKPEPVNWTIPKLREYAKLKSIDVSKLTKKEDIVAAIQKAENPETNKEKQE